MLKYLRTTPRIESATSSDLSTVENGAFRLRDGGNPALKMPPFKCNKSAMLTEYQEKENNGNGNAAAHNRYSPHPHPGSSSNKRRPTPSRTPGTQQRQATTKGLSSERRPLKDLITPTSDSDSGLKNGAVRGNSVEKMQGSNPEGLKRRLNGIGSIAREFINRDTPAIRGSLSLEAPKGCFGFLQSAKPLSSTVRKCSPTPIVRPVGSRIRGDGIRTSDPKPKDKIVENNRVLPRSNSDGCRRIGGGTGWSRDRTPRSSTELNRSGPRSLKNSGEIGVKRSKDKSLKGSGEFGLNDSKDNGLRNSGGRQNSPSCPTAKSLGERKISRSGSLRTTPCHNGLKKNCGMDTRTVMKNPGGSYGLRKGVATKSSGEVLDRKHREQGEDGSAEKFAEGFLNRRRQEQVDDILSNSRCVSNPSCQRKAQEIKANLTAIGSPRGRTAPAVQRLQATSLDKVHSDHSHVTPAHKLIEKECASTPAHRSIGRYGDFTPAHKLVATNGDVTPAHAYALVGRKYGDCNSTTQGRVGRGGDVTPAPHTIGQGGDFTPAPNLFEKGGGASEFTPAQNTMHATPEQRTQVTPPVQPSISPEIHTQSLDELEGARQCFGAGHVVAPVIGKVRDRRKCRPRGILTVGEATPLPLDHNRRFSLVPVPAAAYVKWMSPGEAKNLISPSNRQATPSSGQGTPSAGFCSKNPSPQATPSPGFTQGTPSTGFNSTNPSPQATPLSGITQGTPSTGFSSKSPSPQSTPLCGLTQESPQTGFSTKNRSPQAILLSGHTQDPPTVLSLKNPIPQNAPIERFSQAAPLSFSSHFSNLHYTPPSSLSPEMQTFHPTPPFGFSPEMANVNPTSPHWFIEEIPDLHGTPSKTSSNFQYPLATPPFGLTPECQHLQTTSPYVFNLEIPNLHVTQNPGSSPPASSQHGFHPHVSPQCGDSRGASSSGFSTSIASQFGCNPDTFPPITMSQGTPPSWKNQVVPSQLVNSDVVRLGKPKASPVENDICRQEMQMPILSSKDFTDIRISWREGLMSRIFELGKFDCSDLLLEEGEKEEDEIKFISGENNLLDIEDNLKLEYPSSFGNELQLGAPFGSFEYLNKGITGNLLEDDLSDSLVKSRISSASQAVEAESIDTEYVRTSSGDLDWTFWYRNQLFEEAT